MFRSIAVVFFIALSVTSAVLAADSLSVIEARLDNGLTVLILQKRDLPVVSLQVWYRVGLRNERPGSTGISHLLEHMMFKGAAAMGRQDISQAVQKYGGHANAFTSEDYTCYHDEIARDYLAVAVELEAQRMQGMQFDSLEFLTERDVVLEERRLRENSPTGLLLEELDGTAYRLHPYGWPVIGFSTDLRNIALADLVQHYRTYYVPNNATCVVVGDVASGDALELVKRHFGPIAQGTRPLPILSVVEPKQHGERRAVLRRQAKVPVVAIGFHSTRIGDPDSYALEVLSAILSDGESSRLYRSLVRERGIAVYAGGYNRTRIDPTLFTFYAAPVLGHTTAELEAAIYQELQSVGRDGVSERELQKAKNQIESRFVVFQQQAYGLGIQLGSTHSQISWRYVNSYLPNIMAVSNQDIKRVAAAYFTEDNRTVATLVISQTVGGLEGR